MTIFKHIDFEPPNWAEFASAPTTGGSGAALAQSNAAAFPDRGAAGLRVALSSGTGHSFLEHELAAGRPLFHLRFVYRSMSHAGGGVTLFRGLDAAGDEVFRITRDAATRAITASLATGETLSATPPSAGANASFEWHCIELMIDATGGDASLRLNGVPAATASGDFGTLLTRRVQLGAVEKHADAGGVIDLDEIVFADEPIGPVAVEPASDFANAPQRWLVVYNSADADSVAWAERYRAARGVPFANLLGLALSADEEISALEYDDLRAAVESYLSDNRLDAQVLGILLGYRVPGYVDLGGFGDRTAIASLLYDVNTTAQFNALAVDGVPTRPTRANTPLRVTARMDAEDLEAALTHIDRALAAEAASPVGSQMKVWLDPYTTPGPATAPAKAVMLDWAASIECKKTRLPIELSAASEPGEEIAFELISNDGFFWGWADAEPPAGFFAGPSGARVFCAQLDPVHATAPTLRGATPPNWVTASLAAGYAAAVGVSRTFSTTAMPFIRPFFEALRLGWTLGEAWFVASPVLGQGLFLVGDPLMRIALPQAGWELFGPLARLEDLSPDTPSVALREDEASVELPPALRPAGGETRIYVLRHRDAQGRSEAGLVSRRVTTVSGAAVAPPLAPAWRDAEHWPVRIEDGVAKLRAVWEQPLRGVRAASIELEASANGDPAEVVLALTPDPREAHVEVEQALPEQPTRYRWRITSDGGAEVVTPWSKAVVAPAAASLELQLLDG